MDLLRVVQSVAILGTILTTLGAPAGAVTWTVCPAGCFFPKIQLAINASVANDTVMVLSTYNALTAGEVFPIQTLAVQNGPLTIIGEVDAAGVPITTLAVSPSPAPNNDAVILNAPGGTFKNFRIVGANGNPVNRVVAAGVAAGVFGNLHLQGLTIDNVVVDFRSTNFNARSGFDLIADDVVIKNSSVMGVLETYVFVDGDRYTIMNNTLIGLDATNTIRADIAIGFGADLKVPGQAVCSGTPLDYVITGNTIRGFLRGIAWCTGNRATVSNNVIQDIASGSSPNSGSAIETSNSQNVTIANNTISWSLVGGRHGVGVSLDPTSPFVQPCTGVVVTNNTITGRAQRDVQQGIAVQGCTSFQVSDNTLQNFGDANGSLFVAMFAGQATASVIQGNTIQNGNAAGIAYLGSDSTGSAVDATMIVGNTIQNHRRDGIIMSNVRGAGNMVTGNVVRTSNQGLLINTHGYNLQNLRVTMVANNQAFDTASPGAGFFVANSFIASAACNTGSGNGGGLVLAIGVTVGSLAPPDNCAGTTPPTLNLQLNQASFASGQTLILTATLTPGTIGTPVDAYVTVRLPDLSVLSILLGGQFAGGMVPIAAGLTPSSIPPTELLRYTFTGTEPEGSYTVTGMLTQPGTLTLIGIADANPFMVQ